MAHVILQLLRSSIINLETENDESANEVAFYILLGVVVGVSELLLMSLAKMTVQVGKAVGQAVGDTKVCYCLCYCMPFPPSLYVTISCYMSLPPSLYVTASLVVCHHPLLYVTTSRPHCYLLPLVLCVTGSLTICYSLPHCMSLPVIGSRYMSLPPSLYLTASLAACCVSLLHKPCPLL